MTDPRRVEYLPLKDLLNDPRNPKAHDEQVINDSIGRFGLLDPIVRDERTGRIISGHGRTKALRSMESRDQTPPEGVKTDDEGNWLVPVVVGWASRTDAEAGAALIALNRTTELGGWVDDSLLELLSDLEDEGGYEGVGFDSDSVEDLRSRLMEVNSPSFKEQVGQVRGEEVIKPPVQRRGHLDLIFSTMDVKLMPFARNLGWGWGLISSQVGNAHRLIAQVGYKPLFMDNEWHGYDHQRHLNAISQFHPKYATTRDLLTKEQAAEAGVEWYSIEQTLEMAAEVAEHCENVILIPKYECIDRLPREINGKRVVLGFSVPSSYGGTRVPLEQFKGWPVHLLGGSWKAQRGALDLLGDDVVSLDNNHLLAMSRFCSVQQGDGRVTSLSEVAPEMNDFVTGRWLASIIYSLSAIQTAVINDYAPAAQREEFEHEVEDLEAKIYAGMLTDSRPVDDSELVSEDS